MHHCPHYSYDYFDSIDQDISYCRDANKLNDVALDLYGKVKVQPGPNHSKPDIELYNATKTVPQIKLDGSYGHITAAGNISGNLINDISGINIKYCNATHFTISGEIIGHNLKIVGDINGPTVFKDKVITYDLSIQNIADISYLKVTKTNIVDLSSETIISNTISSTNISSVNLNITNDLSVNNNTKLSDVSVNRLHAIEFGNGDEIAKFKTTESNKLHVTSDTSLNNTVIIGNLDVCGNNCNVKNLLVHNNLITNGLLGNSNQNAEFNTVSIINLDASNVNFVDVSINALDVCGINCNVTNLNASENIISHGKIGNSLQKGEFNTLEVQDLSVNGNSKFVDVNCHNIEANDCIVNKITGSGMLKQLVH